MKDREKRSAYDNFGHSAFEAGGAGNGFSGFQAGGFSDIFEDLFSEFTGGNSRNSSNNRGADLKYSLQVTLEEAFTGLEKTIKVRAPAQVKAVTGLEQKVGVQTFQFVKIAEEVVK